MCNGFFGAAQGADVHLVERYLAVVPEKGFGLPAACVVERSVNSGALHNTEAVVIGFSVSDEVNCFSDLGRAILQQSERRLF